MRGTGSGWLQVESVCVVCFEMSERTKVQERVAASSQGRVKEGRDEDGDEDEDGSGSEVEKKRGEGETR